MGIFLLFFLKLENGTDYLYFEDKKLIRNVEIQNIVAKEHHRLNKNSAKNFIIL